MITTQARNQVVRSLGRANANAARNDWHDGWESPTWLDSKEFKDYLDEIADVLFKAGRPLCTREIHKFLGDKARPRWTQDALEIGKRFGRCGVLLTRYYLIYGPFRLAVGKLNQDAEHDRIFEN